MNFLGLSGSPRAASTNSALLAALAAHAPADCVVSIYDGLARLPIFNSDDEGARTPGPVVALVDAVSRCDGLIIACPEYAHGIPGGLKNALDWLVSGPAAVGKPAMLVHASHRSLFARAALREVLKTMSFALYDGPELEVALLGKNPEEVRIILETASQQEAMRVALTAFANFVNRQ